jgi:hypothetical protein
MSEFEQPNPLKNWPKVKKVVDFLIKYLLTPVAYTIAFSVRIIGPCFLVGFYYILYLHADAYLFNIMPVMKRRLGLPFSMVWTAVGAIIGFNVIFNHFMASVIKAHGPTDLIKIERLRLYYKQRQGRKEFREESDRYEGISKEVK